MASSGWQGSAHRFRRACCVCFEELEGLEKKKEWIGVFSLSSVLHSLRLPDFRPQTLGENNQRNPPLLSTPFFFYECAPQKKKKAHASLFLKESSSQSKQLTQKTRGTKNDKTLSLSLNTTLFIFSLSPPLSPSFVSLPLSSLSFSLFLPSSHHLLPPVVRLLLLERVLPPRRHPHPAPQEREGTAVRVPDFVGGDVGRRARADFSRVQTHRLGHLGLRLPKSVPKPVFCDAGVLPGVLLEHDLPGPRPLEEEGSRVVDEERGGGDL